MEPRITVNGESLTHAEAREALDVPADECLGCFLGDDGPDVHDPDCCDA